MTRKPPPTLEFVCRNLKAAVETQARNCQNSVAVSALASRHAPIVRAPNSVPNGRVRAETAGGWEEDRLKALKAALEALYARQADTYPNTPGRALLDLKIDKAEGYVKQAQADIDAIDVSPRIPAGQAGVLMVEVPATLIRIIGEGETQTFRSDRWQGQVWIDLDRPRLQEYRHTDPELLKGAWPLWRKRGDKAGLMLSDQAEPWHVDLFSGLWLHPRMPQLYEIGNLSEVLV